jgi:hypothetical protein
MGMIVIPPDPLPLTPLTRRLIAEAATLPLRDAASALWWQRSTFIREGEAAAPQDLSNRADAIVYGQMLAEGLAQDRAAAPGSGAVLRLRRAHPRAGDTELRDAILAAVKFDDDCNRFFANDGTDYEQQVQHAVARASRLSPGYLETTLRDARYQLAKNMR